MSAVSEAIFQSYEVRKSRKQKRDFLEFAQRFAVERGYSPQVERGYLGAENLVVGNPSKAKVVFTAHYDTCPILPFPNFITPKSVGIYLLYQLFLVVVILVPAVLLGALFSVFLSWISIPSVWIPLLSELPLLAVLFFLLAGPANPHTAIDNTSGVVLLLELMDALPMELRDQAAFVFFDLEETGLFGSAGFASHHKREMASKLLLNFDCVSDGEHLLFVLRKKARPFASVLEKAFLGGETNTVEILSKGGFYPSDQVNFPCGVGVASLKSFQGKILYMDRIHTKRDTVYREENILRLKEGCLRLLSLL